MEAFLELEIKFAEFNNLDPVGMVVCSSGTAALHLALEAFQLPRGREIGGEVLVPDFAMIACARAVTLAGLKPTFFDCGDDLNIRADEVSSWYRGRSTIAEGGGFGLASRSDFKTAIIAVHTYGRRCNMDELVKEAGESFFQETYVIEDSAEAHGVLPHPRTDAMCTSFYRNKIIAGEEGGAVWFKYGHHAALARKLRSLGFTDAHDFYHIPRGHNYRMSNAHAQLILSSLITYPIQIKWRREAETILNTNCPIGWMMPERAAPWVYDLRIPGLTNIDSVVKSLNENGIAARHSFKPMHVQPEYKNCRRIGGEEAEKAAREVLYLPMTMGVANRAEEVFDTIQKELQ